MENLNIHSTNKTDKIIKVDKIVKESNTSKKYDMDCNNCNFENDENEENEQSVISNKLHENDILLAGIRNLLVSLQNENNSINDEIVEKTPQRFLKAFSELTSGYKVNVKKLIENALFDAEDYDDLIIIDDINFSSLCEHHLLPFNGKVSIAYVPDKKILGLSKFARIVQAYSNRLSLQERLTKQIVDCLNEYLKPKGCIVEINSKHACMCLRGIKSIDSITKTIKSSGLFDKDENLMRKYISLKK